MKTLKGHLEHFGLAEVLQTLASNRHTGTLVVRNQGEKKSIAFNIGSIAFINSPGSPSGISLGQILLREGKITLADLEQAQIDQKTSGQLIGRALLDRGKITFQILQDALRKKIEEELYDLFQWDQGDFEFTPGDGTDSDLSPMHRHTQVQVDPQSVVLEGLRQLDESRIIRDRIPDSRFVPKLIPENLPPEIQLDSTEAAVWELIDGNRSVEEIQKRAPDTRFRVNSSIFRFIEESWVRLLSTEEMVAQARFLLKRRDHKRAGALFLALRDSVDSLGNDPGFLLEVADSLGRTHPEEVTETLIQAIRAFRLRGDIAGAWKVIQRLMRLRSGDADVLLLAWSLRQAAPPKGVTRLFEEVIAALRRADRNLEALSVLKEAESVNQGKSQYWLTRSEVERRLQKPEPAAEALHQAMKIAEAENDSVNLLEAARALHALEPGAPGISEKISTLKEKNRGRDRIRTRVRNAIRLTVAGCSLAVILWGWAEWRAQVQLSVAISIAKDASILQEKIRAAEGFEALASDYPLTIAGLNSSRRGKELRQQLLLQTEQMRKTEETEFAATQNTRKEILESTKKGFVEVEELLGEQHFSAARDLALSIARRAKGVTLPAEDRARIYIPTRLRTNPTGAQVFSGGAVLGKTPIVLRLPEGKNISLQLERAGCVTQQVIINSSTPQLLVKLEHRPLSQRTLPAAFDGQCQIVGNSVVVSLRDGRCYAIDPLASGDDEFLAILAGGLPGHPGALLVSEKESLLVAPLAGPVIEINTTDWSQRWTWTPDSPVTAACSFGGGWAIGAEDGTVHLLDHAGRIVTSHRGQAPITSLLSDGKHLRILDQSQSRYSINRRGRIQKDSLRFTDPCHSLLPGEKTLLVDGRIQQGLRSSKGPIPVTEVGSLGDRIFYGVEGGWVLIRPDGATFNSLPANPTATPVPCDLGYWIPCADSIIRLIGSKGEERSSIQVDGWVKALLATDDGKILALYGDGRISVHEGVLR